MTRKHSHYHKDVKHLDSIDVYRVIDLFAVTDGAAQHALKKLLCAGQRGNKTFEQDIREAHDTLARRLQMFEEDAPGVEVIGFGAPPVNAVSDPVPEQPAYTQYGRPGPRGYCKTLGCGRVDVAPDGFCTDCTAPTR